MLFDIYGHSPMVQHFLRKRDLVYDKGLALLFKRTEISSTPVQSGLTYQEQARESEKRLKSFEKEFDRSNCAVCVCVCVCVCLLVYCSESLQALPCTKEENRSI